MPFKFRIIEFAYKHLFKPLAFLQDPEVVHDLITSLGEWLGRGNGRRSVVKSLFYYEDSILEQEIWGIKFKNPIGLAAGFDKNAILTNVLPDVGFGFAEVGSITGEPCEGNPKPRLWRLVNSESLLVYYGLKNDGCEPISRRLTNQSFRIPIGISVAKTNSPATVETAAGVADYIKAFKAFAEIGDYTTINISCPNAFGGEPFTDPEKLQLLLAETDKIETKKPVVIKLSPDLSLEMVDKILEVCDRHKIHGIICSNLTKNRINPKIKDNNFPSQGGMSGKIVEDLTNNLIKYVYSKTNGKYVIIGCGGVFNGRDALKKIKLGASLIQLITGMIFRGPQAIGQINFELARLLKQEGFKNVSEAIGSDLNKNDRVLSPNTKV